MSHASSYKASSSDGYSSSKHPAPLSPLKRLCLAIGLPTGVLPASSILQICGQEQVMIEGGRGIVLYSPSRITLALAQGRCVTLCGRDLHCSSYNRACVGIEGHIDSISFHGECDKCTQEG